MNPRILASALALLGASPMAQADSYSQCMKGAASTVAMRDCSGVELKRQDSRLNQAYKQAMASLEAEQQGKLRDAQRLWVKYRDANCGMYYGLTGGTIDQLNGAGCEVDMTKQRADELEKLQSH
ncbi:lysozyme inhibitor LprI family protein [Pseudomonas japonica]|uniref:lysozyme inhibitor LprI family protein n=1 Tax=Pseudomonas japonica TaxID=256466 RepID=UPI0037F470AC